MNYRVCAASMAALLWLLAPAGGVRAAEPWRVEWEVGQSEVSGADLAVEPLPEAPTELTIQQAVEAALQRNAGFRRTIQQLLSAQSEWAIAHQRWDLELSGRITRTSNGGTFTDRRAGADFSYSAPTGALFSVSTELSKLEDEETATTTQASLRQPLLAGVGRASSAYEELRRARNNYRAALLSFFTARQSLLERVISSYFGVVQQQQTVTIQENSVQLAQQAVNDAQARLAERMIIELDLMRAQLRLKREQASLVQQRQNLQDAMDRFLVLLGMRVGGQPRLTTMVSYQPQEANLEEAVAKALELRPELQLARLSIEDREAALRISRSQRLPRLDLFGGWRRASAAGPDEDDQSWNVGLELSVPVASRALQEAVRQAYWGLLLARRELEDERQGVVSEVRAQVRAAQAARANTDIALESVALSRRSLQVAQRLVEEGIRTNRDLLDAQDDLTRNEISLVTSKIGYYLASVRLRQAMGLDLAADLPTEIVPAPAGEGSPAAAVPEPAPPADAATPGESSQP